jgi:leucyl-tRNA synthetase
MFMGPMEEGGDYRDEGIQGPFGFLNRLWDTVCDAQPGTQLDNGVERKLHKTIKQASQQIPELGYNTAIAAMMEYLNAVRAGGRSVSVAEVEPLVVMVAPFAPHLAEELWERLGHTESIFAGNNWPSFDASKAADDVIEVGVQVNGKLRGKISGSPDMEQQQAEDLARAEENVARHLEGKEVRRVIFVPQRLLNFVVS